jgi:hypothetical protein
VQIGAAAVALTISGCTVGLWRSSAICSRRRPGGIPAPSWRSTALRAAVAAEQAATTTLQLAPRQWETGLGNDLALLAAERGQQQTALGVVQAHAARYLDTAALFRALGGGWWNRTDIPSAAAGPGH